MCVMKYKVDKDEVEEAAGSVERELASQSRCRRQRRGRGSGRMAGGRGRGA